MLRREYELSLGCDHPHLVHVFTYEEHTPVGEGIVMEYIEGRTLAEWLDEKPAMEARQRIFEELLAAVGYLHSRGITHNDLKAENILISRQSDTLKLLDFGLSDDDAHFLLRTPGCTPAYASPELLARGEVDNRSDIYSIGRLMQTIFGQRYGRFVRRCCAERREDRYADVASLQRAFAHRNRWWRWPVGIVVALLFLLPTFHYASYQVELRRQQARREALFTALEARMEARCNLALDSMQLAPYKEFASNAIYSFFDDMPPITAEMIDTISDSELLSATWHHYSILLNQYNDIMWQRANALPSIYDSSLSIEEVSFYQNLFHSKRPYIPFSAN